DPCWPLEAEFAALNETLAGRLIAAVPPASVCYPRREDFDEQKCNVILASWFSSSFHAADPISIDWPWWANNSCPPIFPNGTSVTGDASAGSKGCSIGGYPEYSVNATSYTHVVAAVNFAREYRIRLNVKSTGHSFQGRSTAYGSLSVWTHHMRGIEYYEDFKPTSSPLNITQAAFKIAAGEQGKDVYETANKHKALVVAGNARDVGIVGHFSSGGHGPSSSTYGLSVDNILEIQVVTPDGEHRTANPCLNPDLFWAIRGGGGGTFGIVTSVTIKAYPSPQCTRHNFSLSLVDAKNATLFWDLVAYIMSKFPALKAGGMQGYSSILPPGVIPGSTFWTWTWGFDLHDKPNGTAEALFAPIAAKLNPLNGTSIVYTSSVQWYPDFYSLWNSTTGEEAVAVGGAVLGSRLLPAEALLDQTRLSSVLQQLASPPNGQNLAGQVLQPYMIANNRTGRDGSVSVTPAWADTVLHFVVSEGYRDNNTFVQAQPVFQRLQKQRVKQLKSLAPDSGAYQNEGDPFDSNWQFDFFGPNYARLKKIKVSVDPDALLWCISCVGSEEWVPDASGRLCKASWAEFGNLY
ncbi:FAD-linked oxidoreductase-like protein 18, partial [Stagonosporopsis vannaccii]